jgi:hypothetical protein
MGPFPITSEGYDYLMVVICRLTSMLHVIPTMTTAKAHEIAWLFLNEVVRLHGMPESIVSDRDSKFTSKFWQELHRLFGVKLLMSTAFHPQTDGMAENAVKMVSQVLRTLVDSDQQNWRAKLPMTEFALNSAIKSTHGFAPFELNYGWIPTICGIEGETKFQGVKQFANQALDYVRAAHDALIANRVLQTHYANKRRLQEPDIKVGTKMYLSTENLNLPKGRARKLLPRFIGPFPVKEVFPSTSNYLLELPKELANRRIHPKFHISRLRPHVPNDDERFPRRDVQTFYDFGLPEEAEWFVDEIIGHRWTRNKLDLQVRWSLGDVTWEPLSTCNELAALDNYLVLHGVDNPKNLHKRSSN